jgi:hypothetical protein
MVTSYGYNNTRPRTQVILDASSLGSANAASEKPLVLIGSANGGQPGVAIELTNFAQARDTFRSGELLDAIEMAWNPSPTVNGAGKIYAIRTDQATQATLVNSGLTITSLLYGADANGIQVEYLNDTVTSSKMLNVYFTKESYQATYDNIGNIFTVQYKGADAYASVEVDVDATSHLATTLVIKAGADSATATVVRSYPLGTGLYNDVNVLVNDINNIPDWSAAMNTLGGNHNITTDQLDALAATACKAAAVTVQAIGADLVNQTAGDQYISITVDRSKTLPATIALTSLSGAATNPAPATWSDFFNAIPDLGAYYVVPLTSDTAIHGELSQFLRDESNNGDQLRSFVGAAFRETIDQLKARQMNLRNARVSLVGNSGTRRMADGRVYNFPAYMLASLIGGVASGLPIGEPLTYKHLNIDGLDVRFTGDQLDQLDASGVIMVEFIRTRQDAYYRVVSDPTTYNVATEPVQNRISLGEVSDFLTTELRAILDSEFIGTRIGSTSASILKNRVESFLDTQKKVDGLIVDYNPDDVQVVITGNTARINFTVQPTQGLDYINVYITYQDDQLSA